MDPARLKAIRAKNERMIHDSRLLSMISNLNQIRKKELRIGQVSPTDILPNQ